MFLTLNFNDNLTILIVTRHTENHLKILNSVLTATGFNHRFVRFRDFFQKRYEFNKFEIFTIHLLQFIMTSSYMYYSVI